MKRDAVFYLFDAGGDFAKAQEAALEAGDTEAVQALRRDKRTLLDELTVFVVAKDSVERLRNLHDIAMGKDSAAVQATMALFRIQQTLRKDLPSDKDEEKRRNLEELYEGYEE